MRRVLFISLMVLGIAIAFGVLTMAADQQNILTVVTTTNPPTLDPAGITDYEAGMVTYNIYQTLLTYDPSDFGIRPLLATSWDISSDAKTATFHLRKGVTFQDGTPFNAEAVKYSIERTQAIDLAPATYLSSITKIDVVNDYTITLHSDTPYAFWEDALATPKALSIISPTFVKAHATQADPWAKSYMNDHTCGTGPYMLGEWVQGQYVKLVRYSDYWGGWSGQHFDTVFVRMVREPSVEELMIKSGQADIAYDVPETDMATLNQDPNVVSESLPGMAQLFLPMKCNSGPLSDVRVRKAISYAIDLKSVRQVYPGATKAYGAIPSGMLGADPNAYTYPYDPAKAKQLLTQAGYKAGQLSLKLVYVSGVEWERRAALVVQQNLADVGINLKVESMPWATFFPLLASPSQSPEIYMFYSAARFADPNGILWETFSTKALGPSGYNNGYSNPVFDSLLTRASQTPDRDARAALYTEANQILINDAPAIFVWQMPYPFTFRANLQNVVPNTLLRTYNYYDIYRK
jgi:peptide/nickel transport system substrate-binding protein